MSATYLPTISTRSHFRLSFERSRYRNRPPSRYSRPLIRSCLLNVTMSPSLVERPIETPPRAASPVHRFGTLAVHAGSPHDPTTGAVIEPVCTLRCYVDRSGLGSLPVDFPLDDVRTDIRGASRRRIRVCTQLEPQPVRRMPCPPSAVWTDAPSDNFEKAIAAVEHANYALAFSSGSAATATILQSLAAGSHVVSVSDVYGGTHRYFTKVAAAHGVQVTFSPNIELDVAELIRPGETRLIWIETPSNPTLTLTDIRAVATVAHQHGIKVVVDNTFMSPYVQNPLDHGADIVVHSVTKYINGHSVRCIRPARNPR